MESRDLPHALQLANFRPSTCLTKDRHGGDSLGITHVLFYLPLPSAAPTRPERLLLLDAFFTVTLALPFFAAISSLLASVAFELRLTSWEVALRVRLPAPPWSLRQLLMAVLLLGAVTLFVAMAGHLVADCMFGADCVPG